MFLNSLFLWLITKVLWSGATSICDGFISLVSQFIIYNLQQNEAINNTTFISFRCKSKWVGGWVIDSFRFWKLLIAAHQKLRIIYRARELVLSHLWRWVLLLDDLQYVSVPVILYHVIWSKLWQIFIFKWWPRRGTLCEFQGWVRCESSRGRSQQSLTLTSQAFPLPGQSCVGWWWFKLIYFFSIFIALSSNWVASNIKNWFHLKFSSFVTIATPLVDQRLCRGCWEKGGRSRSLKKPRRLGGLDSQTWLQITLGLCFRWFGCVDFDIFS